MKSMSINPGSRVIRLTLSKVCLVLKMSGRKSGIINVG